MQTSNKVVPGLIYSEPKGKWRQAFRTVIIMLTGFIWLQMPVACAQKTLPRPATQHPGQQQPALTDSALLTLVQQNTFQYFYEAAEPNSKMARERIHMDGVYPEQDQNVVTTGGSGFGIMALLVGIERRFITRQQGYDRLEQMVSFLEKADTYHGAFSHWYEGATGKTKPFGTKDNGGDLVETSFLMQGLLCARQYFLKGNSTEKQLAGRIDKLWRAVDFNWYTRGQNVLYWHWSPTYDWQMDFQVHGYNECLLMYVLAAASPTHTVDTAVYHQGWAMNGKIRRSSRYDGTTLQFFHQGDLPNGGPLFWSQYSYLGLDPNGLKDRYGDYGQENKNQTLINYRWCVDNPKGYKGYGPESWGLSASYSIGGYMAHAPNLLADIGVISPTAALSSFPYTPEKSMQALRYFYEKLGPKLWGKYGFYDAFSETDNWFPDRYLAIDQGPIVVMIENYRSGLLWKLFMSCPEVSQGLTKLGFQWPHSLN
ncbi:MAG TPA: glucoamylase family protein [Arachidicoccus sp.]|nr:glucoamylase family protein [Arachidicoccus sp.]